MQQFLLIKATYILVTSILLCSCALTGFQKTKHIQTIQIAAPQNNLISPSIIILARPFSYSQTLVNYVVKENGNNIGLITNESYMRWETNRSNITISLIPSINPNCYTNDDVCLNAKVDLPNIKTSLPISTVMLNAISDRTYFLIIKPQFTLFTDMPGKVDIIKSDAIELSTLEQPIIVVKN